MEFEDVRGYQPGDDVRNIDWRVTARTTVAHTRTFTEERERPVLICCDQRATMFFGSRVRFKSVQAANFASLLAWAALKRKDRVGGLLLGASATSEFKPRSGHRSVLTLLAGLNQLNHQLQRETSPGGLALSEAITELRRIGKTGSTIFLLSDFYDLDQRCLQQLYELSRHNSVTAIAVYDPLERELPPAGIYSISGYPDAARTEQGHSEGAAMMQLNTGDQRAREHFARQAQHAAQQRRDELGRLGIALLEVSTAERATDALARLFQRAGGGRAIA